mgnify:CR=1 FL=1
MSIPTEHSLVQKIILDHLDFDTHKIWEQQSSVDSVPTLDDLLNFIEKCARVLDVAPPGQLSAQQVASAASIVGNSKSLLNKTNDFRPKCFFFINKIIQFTCVRNLLIYQCPIEEIESLS